MGINLCKWFYILSFLLISKLVQFDDLLVWKVWHPWLYSCTDFLSVGICFILLTAVSAPNTCYIVHLIAPYVSFLWYFPRLSFVSNMVETKILDMDSSDTFNRMQFELAYSLFQGVKMSAFMLFYITCPVPGLYYYSVSTWLKNLVCLCVCVYLI